MHNSAAPLEANRKSRSNAAMALEQQNLQDAWKRALDVLQSGALAVVPTDTVYGLVADARNCDAVQRLYALKQRPPTQPFSLLVADGAMAERYGFFDDRARRLAAQFWPGAMTLIVPARTDTHLCPDVLAGGNTLGLRVPDHAQLQAMIAQMDAPLAAPSANLAGQMPPLSFQDIHRKIQDGAAYCVDGAPGAGMHASTLVDMSGPQINILRKGALGENAIRDALAQP
jgi:L-threonylcarbamoyladenylate synthase